MFVETHIRLTVGLMISTTDSPALRQELEMIRAALGRYRAGEEATGALDKEGVRGPGPATAWV